MPLNILTIIPANKDNDVAIDSNIVIEVSEQIDPFTVATGINLYTTSKGLLDNQMLAGLDTNYSEVLDIGDVNTTFPFNYQVVNNTITITPQVSLLPDTTFFVDIFPGNDATRYLSKKTVGSPIVVSASGTVDISSYYSGATSDTYEITFSSSDGLHADTIDVAKGIKYINSFKFESGKEVNLGDLKIILHGAWEVTDSISIPVFNASGLTDVYRLEFTTSKYTTITPRSTKIEYISETEDQLKVVRTSPADMSINNKNVNPIVIEFNKVLLSNQDLTGKISIKRTGLEDGVTKNINQYYRVEGNTIKVYMISTSRI